MNNMRILIISLALGIFVTFSVFPQIGTKYNHNIDIDESYRGGDGNKEDNYDEFDGGVKVHEQRGPYQAVTRLDEE